MASKLRRILLVVMVLIIVFTSVPSSRAQAASSSVGRIFSQVTCSGSECLFRLNFAGTYDGQWVYYRMWLLNSGKGIYEPTPWVYTQAYTDFTVGTVLGDIHVAAPSGSIISVKIESYFYNDATRSWDYAGWQYANHYQLSPLGTPRQACQGLSIQVSTNPLTL